MKRRLAVVMDAPDKIHYKKDSTLAMLWEAQARGFAIDYIDISHLYLLNNQPRAKSRPLTVYQDPQHFYDLGELREVDLASFAIILMRKDPPFNDRYLYATFILERAEALGATVVNKPQSLRDANEKVFAANFPELSPPTLITQSIPLLQQFWQTHGDIVCKPLDLMGGQSIFRIDKNDPNAQVIFETLTKNQSTFITAQKFIPEITAGDKRILFVDGEIIPQALVRVPQLGDWRGNLAVGAKGEIKPLTKNDLRIAATLKPIFKQRGLYFVGIDIIGDYLTEINVTSPTGIREIEAGSDVKVCASLFDVLERLIKKA